jgi:RTX calcium-binding nonapeptide repeat (4 copies)
MKCKVKVQSLVIPRAMAITTVAIFLSLLLLFTALERESHLSLINTAWAKSGHKKVAPFANSLPSDDLCVTCDADKNIIRGQGLIVGSDHWDYIIGSTLNDIIFGKDGSDMIFDDLGVDTTYGGNGDDTVQGGPGNDQLLGEDGDDNLFGGFDDDLLVGGSGNDHLFGDIGNDILTGGSGPDYFDCGDGIDTVTDFDPAQGDVMAGNCEIF